MRTRRQRLQHLLELQKTVEGLQEMRLAGAIAENAAAEAEVVAMLRVAEEGKLADLFPDIYTRRIALAHERRAEAVVRAKEEGKKLTHETRRTSLVARSALQARREEERQVEERDLLERLSRRVGQDGDVT